MFFFGKISVIKKLIFKFFMKQSCGILYHKTNQIDSNITNCMCKMKNEYMSRCILIFQKNSQEKSIKTQ